jgi:epoxyqueuosine reductase
MGYLARPDRLARRRDLSVILPGVRTLVMVGLDYLTLPLPAEIAHDPRRGRVAAYAWGVDYHPVLSAKLEQLAIWLRDQAATQGDQVTQRVYVDTGAILERSHGQQAGLGFVGKNTLLIDPRPARGGSYFFLGELLTTAEVDHYDTPARDTQCGSCQRCLNACPTGAFPTPYTLDARRCISYLTIEYKGQIDPVLRPLIGNWVYGCDVCQAVCPWNRFAVQTREPSFYPLDVDRAAPLLTDLLHLTAESFQSRFSGSALVRIGRDRLVRNACIAAGNNHLTRDSDVFDQLSTLAATDSSDIVREAATWALLAN